MVSIREYLTRQGYNTVSDETTSHIPEWEDWYTGYVKEFHRYNVYNGIRYIGKNKYSMGMAKTISEDWANLLLNEKVKIYTGTEFDKQLDRVFAYNNFRVKGNQLIELAFAFGTGAFVEYLDSAGEVVIDFIRASMIYPLSWDNGYVNECAFGSLRERDGKQQYYIQIHKLNEHGLYVIENHIVDADSGKEIDLDADMIPLVETGSAVPLFQIVTPNMVNNISIDSPLGISIYANAIPQLKGCDTVYDSYINEFILGKKRITVPLSMSKIKMSETGAAQPIFDPNDTAFYALPEDKDGHNTLKEIDLHIRAQEHELGINKTLDLLSFKCGLGTGRYKFENGTAKTATEVISEKSDLFQSLKKHEIMLESALKGLVNAVAYLLGVKISDITIDFDDSIIEDKTSERKQDMQDISIGAMQLWEYRMKYYGEDEKTAKEMVTNSNDEVME